MVEMITFDRGKCTRCGICSDVCPVDIILREGDGVPSIPEDLYPLCRKCGHCEVFCPAGAVSSRYEGSRPDWQALSLESLDPALLKGHLAARRTVRNFREGLVEKGRLEEIMDAVRFAPTGSNRQPVKWIFVNGPEKVRDISDKVSDWMASVAETDGDNPLAGFFGKAAKAFRDGNDMITRKAPQLVIAVVPVNNPWARADSVIALSWFEILCQSYGIGTCWLGLVQMAAREEPSILSHLPVPDGHECGYTMAFGYSKYSVMSFPKRKSADISWV